MILARKQGETIEITTPDGDVIVVTLAEIRTRNTAAIGIDAPNHIKIEAVKTVNEPRSGETYCLGCGEVFEYSAEDLSPPDVFANCRWLACPNCKRTCQIVLEVSEGGTG